MSETITKIMLPLPLCDFFKIDKNLIVSEPLKEDYEKIINVIALVLNINKSRVESRGFNVEWREVLSAVKTRNIKCFSRLPGDTRVFCLPQTTQTSFPLAQKICGSATLPAIISKLPTDIAVLAYTNKAAEYNVEQFVINSYTDAITDAILLKNNKTLIHTSVKITL
jgi:hypothetical protein